MLKPVEWLASGDDPEIVTQLIEDGETPMMKHERSQLEAEVKRRLRLPIEQWEAVEDAAEFTSDARAYLEAGRSDRALSRDEEDSLLDDAERNIGEMDSEMRARFLEEFGDPAEMLAQPGLQPVLYALSPDYSVWLRAIWLVSPNEWLDDELPLEIAKSGGIEQVVKAAWNTRGITIG